MVDNKKEDAVIGLFQAKKYSDFQSEVGCECQRPAETTQVEASGVRE